MSFLCLIFYIFSV